MEVQPQITKKRMDEMATLQESMEDRNSLQKKLNEETQTVVDVPMPVTQDFYI